MSVFIVGQSRTQVTLFPEVLDDFILENNPVRVIDTFVNELNLAEMGFKSTTPKLTGRPGYAPAIMLKLYIYGYLNRIQSSRRLERESQRNVELMWLVERHIQVYLNQLNEADDENKAEVNPTNDEQLLAINKN